MMLGDGILATDNTDQLILIGTSISSYSCVYYYAAKKRLNLIWNWDVIFLLLLRTQSNNFIMNPPPELFIRPKSS